MKESQHGIYVTQDGSKTVYDFSELAAETDFAEGINTALCLMLDISKEELQNITKHRSEAAEAAAYLLSGSDFNSHFTDIEITFGCNSGNCECEIRNDHKIVKQPVNNGKGGND